MVEHQHYIYANISYIAHPSCKARRQAFVCMCMPHREIEKYYQSTSKAHVKILQKLMVCQASEYGRREVLTLLAEVLSSLDKLPAAVHLPEETEQELGCALPAALSAHGVHSIAPEDALHADHSRLQTCQLEAHDPFTS